MPEVISWDDPPDIVRGHRTSKYLPVIEEVKANPNRWALVMQNVNTASAKVLKDHGLKITTRKAEEGDDGRVDVWAMFEADEEEEVEVESRPSKKRPSRRRPTKA